MVAGGRGLMLTGGVDMSDSRECVVVLRDCPVSREGLLAVVSGWRADGGEDDWWQEAIGEDGAVYDVNIFDSGVYGHGRDVGMEWCVYRTVEGAGGLRETDVYDVIARGSVSSLAA